MGLLGSLVCTTTLAGVTTGDVATFAHGLPASPHFVYVHENATTDSTSACKLAWKSDATNVSVYNHGQCATATLEAVALVFHSMVK